ncbi:MAG: hypothetical protein LBS89_02870 [Zoogloeaceae bacterium]|jgi:hypothetical protein|nr:hypothetical protein [Zoogloeaceae bacterium]
MAAPKNIVTKGTAEALPSDKGRDGAGFEIAPTMLSAKKSGAVSVRVTAHSDGFRRAGRAWSTKSTVLKLTSISRADLEILIAEPRLVVVFLDAAGERVAAPLPA